MNVSTLALLALLMVQSAESPKFIVPDVPDVTIKTRETYDRPDSSVETHIIYLKGARQRREHIVEWPARSGAGATVRPTSAHLGVSITQCDERRTLLLNHEAQTYAYSPIEDMSAHVARLGLARNIVAARTGAPTLTPPREEATGGVVTITIDAVDTGERRQVGRYTARHVITTRKTEPGPGASTRASVSEQDGWYIDLPSPDCSEREQQSGTFLMLGQVGEARDHFEFKQRGTARRGYPIEETHRTHGEPDAISTKLELIEISDKPLDAALFDVPTGYQAALPSPYGGYDLSKPDTFLNRVQSYGEFLTAWAENLFRGSRSYGSGY